MNDFIKLECTRMALEVMYKTRQISLKQLKEECKKAGIDFKIVNLNLR